MAAAAESFRAVPAAPGARLRLALWLGAGLVAVAAGAAALGSPEGLLAADPELARLLRGMALVKAALVAGAAALVGWRFGRPVDPRIAAGYLAAVWAAGGAAMLIWQLTLVGPAAVLFHLGELALLGLAWHDDGALRRRGRGIR